MTKSQCEELGVSHEFYHFEPPFLDVEGLKLGSRTADDIVTILAAWKEIATSPGIYCRKCGQVIHASLVH